MEDFDARAELLAAIEDFGLSEHDISLDDATTYATERSAQHGPDFVRAHWDIIVNEFSVTGAELV